ncbi:hypothetical protein BSKO_00993 [Bryopsis sp. KO-2023]|nr:hypothetical protein BSKO_00993 [Bryopsis sp. KO-2023]
MSESSLDDDLLIAATIAAEEEHDRRLCEQGTSNSPATRVGGRRGGDSTALHNHSDSPSRNEYHEQPEENTERTVLLTLYTSTAGAGLAFQGHGSAVLSPKGPPREESPQKEAQSPNALGASSASRSMVASRDLDQCDGLRSLGIQGASENSQAAITTSAIPSQDNSQIPPIEEAYSAQNRVHLFRPHGVFVTDFTSSEWCQVQTAFKLHQPERASKSAKMRLGSKRHEELETQIHVKIPVAVSSREDEVGLRVFNSIFCIMEILDKGLTRELPVFGTCRGVWFRGVVDELRLCKESNTLQVIELKTRGSKRPPSQAQMKTAKLQVMLYRRLLEGLGESCRSPMREQFMDMLGLDPKRRLADVVTMSMSSCGFQNVETLEGALGVLAEICDTLPAFSQTCRVVYESQDDKSVVAEEAVQFDPEWLDERVDDNLQFWCGASEPCGVPSVEAWKCRFCDFNQICKRKPQLQ